MAYSGYILKIGNWTVPNKYIEPSTYDTGLDRDKIAEWTDFSGERHVVFSNRPQPVVSFETPKNFKLTNQDIAIIQEALKTAQLSPSAPIYNITFYDVESDSYITKSCTLDDVTYTIAGINEKFVLYEPARFTFKGVRPYAAI